MSLVSIITPTFNSLTTIKESLDSILAQTHRPLEIIVVDDGSADGSYAFAKAYAAKNTSSELTFINLKNTSNSGAGITRNKGIEAATGTYIAFLDADDLWKPHKLEVQLHAMKKQKATFCYGAYEIFKSSPDQPEFIHQVFEKLTFERLLKANYLGNLTGIYNAKKLGKFYMPALRKRQDWAMWLDVIQKAEFAIGIQKPIASYHKGDGLSSNKLDLIKYNYAVYRTHLGYSTLKSSWMMLQFFYEQFFVKSKLLSKVK
ncbi:glycosyltransferase family 2 protein [Nonlabens sp. Ci31]|jgi:glycosyltransferase involved in cell wall biosynthesis|uniref:glycosyltransferase family 2 protein n=1 Tax=Nonlabens sp. Ci31 TaxID=2608253 RepID=UPI001463FA6F|nr:glycosyltransferase family 2 protein [Nonlabens sp. Ci31]QJP33826.1 glycosyltransferase family 2 protein [Nonlabens sp. Ci31]